MNTRTPLAPDSHNPTNPSPAPLSPATREPVALDDELRRFSMLSPMEQLERLEADGRRLNEREQAMRTAEAIVNIGKQKPNEYYAPRISDHDAEVQHQQAQAQRLK